MAAGWLAAAVVLSPLFGAAADRSVADAARRQDREAVRALIKQHADANLPLPDGSTALAWAAHWDDLETVDLLLEAGARAGVPNMYGVTPLALAAMNRDAAIVNSLLAAGADPNATTAAGEPVLLTAAGAGNADVVRTLLDYGADISAKESGGQDALMWAAAEGHADAVRVLIDYGADVRAKSKRGFTPLLFAAQIGDVDTARALLAAHADINTAAPGSGSPLIVAVAEHHDELAKFLLDNGADVKATDLFQSDPRTATIGAAPSRPAADSAAAPPKGMTALHLAVWRSMGRVDLIKYLIAHGAEPNVQVGAAPPRRFDEQLLYGDSSFIVGATPLLLAAANADIAAMRTLLAGGADPHATSSNGTTLLIAAAGTGRLLHAVPEPIALDVIKLAFDLAGDAKAADKTGNTALHIAVAQENDTVIRFLVDKGADVNAKSSRGFTPLDVADGTATKGSNRVVHAQQLKLLREMGGKLGAELGSPATASQGH